LQRPGLRGVVQEGLPRHRGLPLFRDQQAADGHAVCGGRRCPRELACSHDAGFPISHPQPTRALTRLLLSSSSWIEKVAYEDFDPRLVPAVGTGGCHVFAACSDTHELDSACPTPGSANPMPTECFALPAFPYPPGVDPTVHDDVVEFWAGWNAGGCPSTPASEPFRNLIDETCSFTSPAIIDEQQFVCMRNTTDICM